MCTCIYACLSVYTPTYVYVYTHTCACVYAYLCVCMHTRTPQCVCMHMPTCVCVCRHMYTYVCLYTHIYTDMHTHSLTSVHMCRCIPPSGQKPADEASGPDQLLGGWSVLMAQAPDESVWRLNNWGIGRNKGFAPKPCLPLHTFSSRSRKLSFHQLVFLRRAV